jgi:hypothetical protein
MLVILSLFLCLNTYANERIFISLGYDGPIDIWEINPDGSDAQRSFDIEDRDLNARISPDGTKVLYVHHAGTEFTLRIADLSNGHDYQLTGPNSLYGIWSPDGTQVIYHRWTGHWHGTINIIDVDGSNDRVLISPASPYTGAYPEDWQHDRISYRVAYSHSATYRVYLANSDGSNPTQLVGRTSTWSRFHPWENKIAYDVGDNLFIRDLDTQVETKIETPGGSRGSFAFSPTGSQIAYADMSSNLHVMDIDGSNNTIIFSSPAALPVWEVGDWATISTTVDVDIDVKPADGGRCLKLNGHGVIPVVIFGSDAFDVTQINLDTTIAESLSFNGLAVRVRGNKGPLCSTGYDNDDQFLDLICHFEDDPSQWVEGSNIAELTGQLLDGTSFRGLEPICVSE